MVSAPALPGLGDELGHDGGGPFPGLGGEAIRCLESLAQPGHAGPAHDRARASVDEVRHQQSHRVGAQVDGGPPPSAGGEGGAVTVAAPERTACGEQVAPVLRGGRGWRDFRWRPLGTEPTAGRGQKRRRVGVKAAGLVERGTADAGLQDGSPVYLRTRRQP